MFTSAATLDNPPAVVGNFSFVGRFADFKNLAGSELCVLDQSRRKRLHGKAMMRS